MRPLRKRHAIEQLKRKLRFSPVVTLQGVRQSGKSTLARELLENQIYTTLDRAPIREQAQTRTESWIEELRVQAESAVIVIDEAQKAPAVFDQIKYVVDRDKRPGQFILLGSTEFSRETLVNESLTGRVSRMRIFTLTLAETLSLPFSDHSPIGRPDLVHFLSNGGFPGIFAIRDKQERVSKLEEWIQLTCERDVLQIKRIKADPDLCIRILEVLPHLEEPTQASIANRLKVGIRKAEANLKALAQIFAVHPIQPSSLGTGKTLYFLPDPSMVSYFKGSFEAQLESALLTEFLAKRSYGSNDAHQIRYYRNSKGHRVHFILENSIKDIEAYKLTGKEKYDLRDAALLVSLKEVAKKNDVKVKLNLIGGFGSLDKDQQMSLIPWENLF